MDVERSALALGAWLLTYAVHSTVLIGTAWLAAIGLARLACRSASLRDSLPALRERLWKTALVGGIATATLQVTLGLDPWGMRPALADRSMAVDANKDSIDSVTAAAVERAAAPASTLETSEKAAGAAAPRLERNALDGGDDGARADFARGAAANVASPSSSTWVLVVLGLWATGVGFGLMRWMIQWNRLLRSLDDRKPIVSGRVHEIFQHLRARSSSRSRTTLCAAPSIAAPITLGLRRLEICLPPRVEDELQHDEIGALLAHELAHAERADPRWLALCRLVEVVFFFQPLNKLCSAWIQDEAEYLCDDWAVVQIGERVPLASCLTEIAGWIVHEPFPRLAPGMAARGTRLSMRVRRLLDEDHEPARGQRGGWIALSGAASFASLTLFVPGIAAETTTLDERTRELEVALRNDAREDDCVTFDTNPCDQAETPANPAPRDTMPDAAQDSRSDLASILAELDSEIDRLRDELAERGHDATLWSRLDALAQGIARLRERNDALELELARTEIDASLGTSFDAFHSLLIPNNLRPKD